MSGTKRKRSVTPAKKRSTSASKKKKADGTPKTKRAAKKQPAEKKKSDKKSPAALRKEMIAAWRQEVCRLLGCTVPDIFVTPVIKTRATTAKEKANEPLPQPTTSSSSSSSSSTSAVTGSVDPSPSERLFRISSKLKNALQVFEWRLPTGQSAQFCLEETLSIARDLQSNKSLSLKRRTKEFITYLERPLFARSLAAFGTLPMHAYVLTFNSLTTLSIPPQPQALLQPPVNPVAQASASSSSSSSSMSSAHTTTAVKRKDSSSSSATSSSAAPAAIPAAKATAKRKDSSSASSSAPSSEVVGPPLKRRRIDGSISSLLVPRNVPKSLIERQKEQEKFHQEMKQVYGEETTANYVVCQQCNSAQYVTQVNRYMRRSDEGAAQKFLCMKVGCGNSWTVG